MQIPQGNFGQSVAQPATAINVPRQDVSSGADALDSTASAAVSDAQSRAADIFKQQNAAKASLALATSTNQLHDAAQAVTQGIQDGSIAPEDAQTELAKRTSAVMGTAGNGLTQQHADVINAQLTGTAGDLSRGINGVVFKQQQSNTAATLDETANQLTRQIPTRGWQATSDSFDAVMDMTGQSAGLLPAQIQLKKDAFRQTAAASFYGNQGANAYAEGDVQGVGNALHSVMGPDGDALDPVKREELTHRLAGYQSSLIAQDERNKDKAARLQEAAERRASDTYQGAFKTLASGQVLDPSYIDKLSADTAGTSWAQMAGDLLKNQAPMANFASKTAAERSNFMDAMRQNFVTEGTDPGKQKVFDLYSNIDKAETTAFKENPWQAALQYGVIQNLAPLDMSDMGNAPAAFAQRMSQIQQVEAAAGTKVSPLQPQEATDFGNAIRHLPTDQAGSVLSQIGAKIADPERTGALAKQMGDKDRVLGLALTFADQTTDSGRTLPDLILQGQKVMGDKTSQDDTTKQTGWRATIAGQVRGAYADPTAEQAAIDAAVYVTAAREVNDGAAGDTDTAVKLVTGGVIQHGAGKTTLPYGMQTSTDFDNALGKITPAAIQSQAPDSMVMAGNQMIPLDAFVRQLPNATLLKVGRNSYNVMAGKQTVTNTSGTRIRIDINGPVAPPQATPQGTAPGVDASEYLNTSTGLE